MIFTFGDALSNVMGSFLFFAVIGHKNLIDSVQEEMFQSSMSFFCYKILPKIYFSKNLQYYYCGVFEFSFL